MSATTHQEWKTLYRILYCIDVLTMIDEDYVERATTFDGQDAPPGDRLDGSESFRNYYKRLSVANTLDWNGKWRSERRETIKNASAIVDAIASQLQLTDYQTEEAHRIFANLSLELNEAHSTSLLALCICALVGRKDGRDYHPNQHHPRASRDTDFARIAEDIGVSYAALYSCWKRIRREVE